LFGIHPSVELWLAGLTAFAITYFSIPGIIQLARLKRLYDEPNHRKEHSSRIPTLGGLALFVGFFFSFVFWGYDLHMRSFHSILSALIILFVVGIRDDLYPLKSWVKLGAQIVAALIVVVQGDVRITNLYGLLDLHDLPYLVTVAISTLAILAIMNGFNLIDGINGLSAGVAVIVLSTYGYWFYRMDNLVFVLLCVTLIGSLLAYLRFNFVRKANIFMGDSGSLVIGYLISVISIRFIQQSREFEPNYFFSIAGAVYAFNLLIIPLFDTLRVSVVRILKGYSPFRADRNHIHHTLIDIGLSHRQASLLLFAVNLGFIAMGSLLGDVRPRHYLLLCLLVALLLSQIPYYIKSLQKARGTYGAHKSKLPQ
jgi:UDP-N-acetylmuramyl pentapeptide phosphotransferase/UDP-N-acetylglucosamine-1-phosphate transferase